MDMVERLRRWLPVGTVAKWLREFTLLFLCLLLALWGQRVAFYALPPSVLEIELAVAAAALLLCFDAWLGVYRGGERGYDAMLGRAFMGTLFGCALVYVTLALPTTAAGRVESGSEVGRWSAAAMYAVIVLRHFIRYFYNAGFAARRTLVVGCGPEAREVIEVLKSRGKRRHELVGVYEVGGENLLAGERLLTFTNRGSLWDTVTRWSIQDVIVTIHDQRNGALPMHDLLKCRIHGVRVLDLPAFHERMRGEFPIHALKASYLIYGDGFEQGLVRSFVKRAFDVAAATALLMVTSPLMILAAILIPLESPGPVIYRQERVGRAGRVFDILKFRSMRNDAENDGIARWAQSRDPRVTRLGQFMRLTRIDELPQLWNVLRGEMSIVGPRPERPCFMERLIQDVRYYEVRLTVKPGLTGWAQVNNGYASSIEDTRIKLQYDLFYVKNHSLPLDLLILLRTVRVIFLAEGAR